ncbi:Dyp-type peroxidase [Sansalvadorimonas sp. 2012CJ34-2]|uniref:Dyp-type peroxidase n=1 Tax=Parendozoicomonas callyspongiae TaxID=2942213 RepID=A0ABT0PF08_9GAMM|nr:Dyp-type peroxidase [Sansalvadorimonas sp. 2012CJ34-2]MCL6269955.1 Dyp-type peroxidase [Sansalvadorimonas sp. 2012CJ34-2]
MSTPQSGILPEANTDATFLVLLLQNDQKSLQTARQFSGSFPSLVDGLAAKYPDSKLSATLSFGSRAWKMLFKDQSYPQELAPFKSQRDGERLAPGTPGDILVHIRSDRKDINFELSRMVMAKLEDSALLEEEVSGFRYLESRDITGFVDGTENPERDNRAAVALVPEGQPLAGGSYIQCQRYIHNMPAWESCPVHHQEQVIGRSKQDNVEFSSEEKAPIAHIKRVSLKEDGKSLEILRHSMPYGDSQEHGLFFISYCHAARHFDLMLEEMIHADGDGHYDHLMNFTQAVTGNAFFAPSRDFLETL